MEIDLVREETIVLFAILFILIGLTAPIVYINLAPEERFVDVHNFDASDTYVGAEKHNVCFERTVNRPSDADITIELILLRDDGSIVEEDSFEVDAYYQQGRRDVTIPRQIRDDEMNAGEYRYVHSVELSYYNGLATKSFTFVSDEFVVHETKEQLQKENSTKC